MAIGEVPAKGNVIPCIPVRYTVSILGSVAMMIIYGLKVNLSVAIVAMVNQTAIASMSAAEHARDAAIASASNLTLSAPRVECSAPNVSTTAAAVNQDGPFVWTSPDQGMILSSYFVGYLVSQIPGAIFAAKASAKWVMFLAVFINAVCTLLTPWAASVSIYMLVFLRILEGLGGGVTFPAEHTLISQWAPPNERSTISSIVYAGTALGTVISMLSAGMIADALGWEAIFYIHGGLSCIWFIFWIFLASDNPRVHALISQEERDLIVSSLNSGGDSHGHGKPQKIPWGAFLKSAPVWGILIAHICNNFGFYMLLIELPIYMSGVLKFNVKENAVFTAFPFFTLWLFSMIISKVLDGLRASKKINTTTARKTATLIASIVPIICLTALCFIGCNRMAAVIIAGVGVTSKGAMYSGFLSNHIDLSPNFAGILVAFTNTFATLPGIIVPLFVGSLTHHDPTIGSWQIIFGVTIVLYIIEIFFYTWLGSGDEQPFNNPDAIKASSSEMDPLRKKKSDDN